MTKHNSSKPAQRTRRYLYGLVATNLAIVVLIVAFFEYHQLVQDRALEKIVQYHSATIRAAQAGRNEIHDITDELWRRTIFPEEAGTGGAVGMSLIDRIEVLSDERDLIADLQRRFADPAFDASATATARAFDAVLRMRVTGLGPSGDVTAHLDLLDDLALRLEQLSRLHMEARDRQVNFERQNGLSNPNNLLVSVSLLTGLGLIIGIGVVRNVAQTGTEREDALSALRLSESRLARLAHSLETAQRIAKVGSWEWDVGSKTERWSDQTYRNLGFEPGSCRSTVARFYECVHPRDREKCSAAVRRAVAEKVGYEIDFRVIWPDGTVHVMLETAETALDAEGNPATLLGTMQDVTAEREAERESATLALRLSNAQRIASLGNWEWDAETKEEWWSDEIYRIFGLEPGSVTSSYEEFDRRVHADDRDRLSAAIQRTQSGEGPPYNEIVRILRPDGSERIVRETGEAHFDASGALVGLSGTVQDITEQFETEAALRETTRRLEAAQRIARVAEWEWDPMSDLLEWPAQMWDVLGLPPSDEPISNDAFMELLHPDDRAPLRGLMLRAVEHGEPYSMEYRFIPPGCQMRTMLEYAEPFKANGSGEVRLRGTVQDITEQKRAQEQLGETLRRFADAQAVARIGNWEWDIAGEAEWWSAQQYRNYGLEPSDGAVEPNCFIQYVHPDDRDRMREASFTAVASGAALDSEFRTIGADGIERVLWGYGEPEFDDDGKPVRMVGTTLDITERKRVENELAKAVRALNRAQQMAHIGSWEWDAETDTHSWSDETFRLLGLQPGSIQPVGGTYLRFVHPDDLDRAQEGGRKLYTNGTPLHLEYRVQGTDGVERMLEVHAEMERDDTGSPVRVVGTAQDITERKRAEVTLRVLTTRLEEAQRIAHVGHWAWYPDTDRSIWSSELYRIFGLEPGPLPPTHEYFFNNILRSVDRKSLSSLMDAALETGRSYDTEFRIVRPSGEERVVFEIAERFVDEATGKVGIQGTVQDITERKQAEDAVRESEARLDAFFASAPAGLALYDSDGRYVKINETLASDHGASVEAHIGKRPTEVLPKEFGQRLEEGNRRALESGERVANTETSAPSPDREGEEIHYVYSRFPIFGRSGEPSGIGVITVNITERKKAEAETAATARLLADAQRMASIGSWMLDTSTGAVRWTDELYRIYGIAESEGPPSRETFLSCVHADDYQRVLEAVESALHDRAPFDETYRIVRTDGEVRILHAHGEWQPDGSGERRMFTGTTQDITERKRAEDAVRESEARLDAFFSAAPVGMAIIGDDYRYMRLNRTLADMHGAPLEDHLGKRPSDVLAPNIGHFVESVLERTLEKGEWISNEEGSGKLPNGSVQHWVYSQFPIPGTEHGHHALGAIVQDITELKNAQQKLSRLNVELEDRVEQRTTELRAAQDELVRRERLVTLGQLTATVSHELRNPLGAMRTSLYVIEKSASQKDERMAKAVARINRSITRCDNIIDELLDFTRIRDLQFGDLPVASWLEALLDELAVPDGIAVVRKLDTGDLHIPADVDRLRRAVINVYENACQAMAEADPPRRGHKLMIATRISGNRLEMIFEDTGPGIAGESIDRIFEPLFSTKNFGVGLGLPVVRQIMEQHGGGIEVRNRRHRGARFVLWLPQERHVEDTQS